MAMKSLGLVSNPYMASWIGRRGLAVSDSATTNTAQAGAGLRCESLLDGETTPETAPPHLITSWARSKIDSGCRTYWPSSSVIPPAAQLLKSRVKQRMQTKHNVWRFLLRSFPSLDLIGNELQRIGQVVWEPIRPGRIGAGI